MVVDGGLNVGIGGDQESLVTIRLIRMSLFWVWSGLMRMIGIGSVGSCRCSGDRGSVGTRGESVEDMG